MKARRYPLLLLMLFALSALLTGQKPEKDNQAKTGATLPAVIWRDPGDMASLNLLYGAGGKEAAPNPNGRFVFVKEDLQATSPKFDVKDDQGIEWRVKLGQEAQSETAATRFLWAAGYFVDEGYYLPSLKVTGLPKLQRGGNSVSADGTVHRAQLERRSKEVKKLGHWDWFDNPFLDTQEFNGLRVMMSLLNNWDLSTPNNSIYEIGAERRYVVSDVGATFGNTGNSFTRSKSMPREYAATKSMGKATPGFIDFVLHSRPFFLSAINVPNYRDRTRMEQITKHIPYADARWLGHRLAMLSEEQIRDGFRAASYTPEEIEVYTQAVRKRIAELDAL
jgi:hypothetical protein